MKMIAGAMLMAAACALEAETEFNMPQNFGRDERTQGDFLRNFNAFAPSEQQRHASRPRPIEREVESRIPDLTRGFAGFKNRGSIKQKRRRASKELPPAEQP